MQSARLFALFVGILAAYNWVDGSEELPHAFTLKTLWIHHIPYTATPWREFMACLDINTNRTTDPYYCDVMIAQADYHDQDAGKIKAAAADTGAHLYHVATRGFIQDYVTATRADIWRRDTTYYVVAGGPQVLVVTEVAILEIVPGVRAAVVNTRLSHHFHCDDRKPLDDKLLDLREYVREIRERDGLDVVIIAGYFGEGYSVCEYYPMMKDSFCRMRHYLTYAGERFVKGDISERSAIYYWARAGKVEVKVADYKKSSDNRGDSAIATFHIRKIQKSDPE